MGACLLAAAGTIHPDLTAAARAMVRPPRMIEPDSATRNTQPDGYRRWTEALRRRGWLD